MSDDRDLPFSVLLWRIMALLFLGASVACLVIAVIMLCRGEILHAGIGLFAGGMLAFTVAIVTMGCDWDEGGR